MSKNNNIRTILVLFLLITTIFCIICSVSAVELSDNNITQNIDDNIINDIEQDNQNTCAENSDDELNDYLGMGDEIGVKEKSSSIIYVSTDGDDSIADGSKNNPYKTIKQGINNCHNESTIYLSEGTYDDFNLSVDKSLTIVGVNDKTIVDGKKIFRIFKMESSAKLTLNGLTLINGVVDGEENGIGGAIYNNGGVLTLINCTIKDSYAGINGGAIYNNNGHLTIINSNFINNSAVQHGGAIYSAGITKIENSSFVENCVLDEVGVGGAIACGGIASFDNTLFLKNHAIYAAGAVLNLANATMNNCSFINQWTNYTAGAISNHNYLIINNSQFIRGYARFYAAALLAPPSGQHVVTEVYNTIFERNYVTNHAAVSNNFIDTELKMENCALVGNYIFLNPGRAYGDVALDDNASLLYCWWGQNEVGNYYSPHTGDWEAWKINASRWLIMTFTSNDGIINQEKNNILTVSLHQYFDNETKKIYDYDKYINLPLTVKFYTDTGKIIGNVILKNGTATINYSPDLNVKTVYAQLNSQILEIPVKLKNESKLTVNDFTGYYNSNKKLEVKLTDLDGNELFNKTVKLTISGKTYSAKTNQYGIAKFSITSYPGTYNAKISFVDEDYRNQNKYINVKILKNITSIIAKNLVKYYRDGKKLTIKLLDNNKKPLASKKIKLTIAGENYYSATNSQGIATFAINNKVGDYNVKISFAGDNKYQKSQASLKVSVKFKTVSKGSKDRVMVKKIQRALKKNGYYIKYKGSKLKVNGIYKQSTVRAVKQFQKAKGLKVTGKVDQKTAKKLKII